MMIRQLLVTALVAGAVSAIFTGFFTSAALAERGHDRLTVKRLEIVDAAGKTRIVMSIDHDGNAKIGLVGAAKTSNSEIVQTRSGETYMQSGGRGQRPSVFLGSGLQVGGPRLELNGNSTSDEQVLLGFTVDDVPSRVSNTGGLFLPSSVGSGYYAGVEAGHVPGEQASHGFMLAPKRAAGRSDYEGAGGVNSFV